MVTFIDELVNHLLKTRRDKLASVEIILPSKRAGSLFRKKLLQALNNTTTFLPRIRSIEELIAELSGLVSASQTHLQFELYRAYLATNKKDPDDFIEFLAWAPGILGDFNEIDRYLIPIKRFFNYLSAIKDVEHWSVDPEPSSLVKDYLQFWEGLESFYLTFNTFLEDQGMGYQGMQYRKAAEKAPGFISKTKSHFIFAGFNALNTAEQQIIERFLKNGNAEIFWDIDTHFLNGINKNPARFINEYFKNWSFYKENPLPEGSNFYLNPKNFKTLAIPGTVGQAKYIGQLLKDLPAEELEQTAIVLGDENLLLPLLSAIPPEVNKINITMGLPLEQVPDASFFEAWLLLQQNINQSEYNSRELLSFLGQAHVLRLLGKDTRSIRKVIEDQNLLYIDAQQLIDIAQNKNNAGLLFTPWYNNAHKAINAILETIKELKNLLITINDKLQLEYLFSFQEIFSQLEDLVQKYGYIKNIKTLQFFYRELVSTETLDFLGDPYEGLQIMGVLESRVLDFKNIMVTGLNEGILPAGKSQGSFIPFDLKREYKLPTYREKDAVYAYHFFRLLQRAENVYLFYNSNPTGLNSSEKSRFLLQLELEDYPQHDRKEVSAFSTSSITPPRLRVVEKTPAIIDKLQKLAAHGFSPSALSTYIRNPLDFYYRYVLGIEELDRVEEVVAHNTLGTIVHESLEQLYIPFLRQSLTKEMILSMQKATAGEVEKQFKILYNLNNIKTGKNLIIYNVALQFIKNLLQKELATITSGQDISILECERKLNVPLTSDLSEVRLRGTVDRIDRLNNTMRIIDYKTGKVDAGELKLKDWELLTTDYKKYGKAFQVLCYALMMEKDGNLPEGLEAGIISFKNLQQGFMAFEENKSKEITPQILKTFEEQLMLLIQEILNINIPFQEKKLD